MQEQFFGLYQVLKEFLSYFSIKMWQLVLRFMSAISSAISSISCIGSTIRLPNAASVPDAAGLTCAWIKVRPAKECTKKLTANPAGHFHLQPPNILTCLDGYFLFELGIRLIPFKLL